MFAFAVFGLSYMILQVVLALSKIYMQDLEEPLASRLRASGGNAFLMRFATKVNRIPAGVSLFSMFAFPAFGIVLGFAHEAIELAVRNQTILEAEYPTKVHVQIKPKVYCQVGSEIYNRGWRQNLRDILGPKWLLRLLLPIQGVPDWDIAVAPRLNKVASDALMMQVKQAGQEGVQEVPSLAQFDIKPLPPSNLRCG